MYRERWSALILCPWNSGSKGQVFKNRFSWHCSNALLKVTSVPPAPQVRASKAVTAWEPHQTSSITRLPEPLLMWDRQSSVTRGIRRSLENCSPFIVFLEIMSSMCVVVWYCSSGLNYSTAASLRASLCQYYREGAMALILLIVGSPLSLAPQNYTFS